METVNDRFSIIIPYRADGGQRDRIREWCIARWQAFCPNAEIVSLTDGGTGLFNRSRTINRSVAKATTDILYITDGDVVPDAEQIRHALAYIRQGCRWVVPLLRTLYYDRTLTEHILNGDVTENLVASTASLDRSGWMKGIWDTSGSSMDSSPQSVMPREVFDLVGGFDEGFDGWGAEDNAFARALLTMVGAAQRVNHSMIHLWHPHASGQHPHTNANNILLNEYRRETLNPKRMASLIQRHKRVRRVNFLACDIQYAEHLIPIWQSLSDDVRGDFFLHTDCLPLGLTPSPHIKWWGHQSELTRVMISGCPVMVSSISDMVIARERGCPVLLMQHGAGQSYSTEHASYPGGKDRTGVVVEFVPNEQAKQRCVAQHPEIPVVVIGSPRVDYLRTLQHQSNIKPVVCVSFHWDVSAAGAIAPESRGAWEYYKEHLNKFKSEGWELIGHAHPRMMTVVESWYKQLGINVVHRFDDVIKQSDVYVTDNSSTIWEAAACSIPVVLLNAPWYRRDVQHGLRFWDEAGVGVQCNDPESIGESIRYALRDPAMQQEDRRASVARVYPYCGESLHRVSESLEKIDDVSSFFSEHADWSSTNRTIIFIERSHQRGVLRHIGEEVELPMNEAARIVSIGHAVYKQDNEAMFRHTLTLAAPIEHQKEDIVMGNSDKKTVVFTKRSSQYGMLFHVGQKLRVTSDEAARLISLRHAILEMEESFPVAGPPIDAVLDEGEPGSLDRPIESSGDTVDPGIETFDDIPQQNELEPGEVISISPEVGVTLMYHCAECDKQFDSKRGIAMHNRQVHHENVTVPADVG